MSARVLTVLGTASDVGKSTVTAALCRLASDAGLRVAPFKAQNMARNAYVVRGGGEIGVAQAVQARAARVEPSVDHNPVLLKPEPGLVAQVVIHGHAVGRFRFGESDALRATIEDAVTTSLARLRETHDLVIVEGAGSPVELNLAARDVPNRFTARLSDGPIVLVGDVDRGGVFAQLVGTHRLLPDDLRARVHGVVVNKLRGDPALFVDGVRILQSELGVPVLAVLPYLEDLGLEDEDSVAFDRFRGRPRARLDEVEITVVDTPCLANAEDALPFEREAGVRLRASNAARELLETDLVLLLGSKSTAHDLAFVRDRGIDLALRKRARQGRPTFGICGGLQMLGRTLEDPDGVESTGGTVPGLGLLGCATRFAPDKTTRRMRARFAPNPWFPEGFAFDGFHLHHGRVTADEGVAPFAWLEDGTPDGVVAPDAQVAGTMLHRAFDEPRVRAALLADLRRRRGLASPSEATGNEAVDPIDRLARHVASHADPVMIASLFRGDPR